MSHLSDEHMPADRAVEMVLPPRTRDIGGMRVGRILPSARGQMIGPFIFFDTLGPVCLAPGAAEDVLPHPHIGLATVTYLFDGHLTHRDSLGSEQVIVPGAVNLMSAGRGIVHSERHGEAVKAQGGVLAGVQTWLALPQGAEESAPAFHHVGAESLPEIEDGGLRLRVILGEAHGLRAPVPLASPTLYLEAMLKPGASLPVDATHEERAVFIFSGEVEIDGMTFPPGQLALIRPGLSTRLRAHTDARLLVLGGASLDGPRYIWWNFVSSDVERVRAAAEDWRQGRFDGRFAPIPCDHDSFIPAPADGPGRPRAQRPRT